MILFTRPEHFLRLFVFHFHVCSEVSLVFSSPPLSEPVESTQDRRKWTRAIRPRPMQLPSLGLVSFKLLGICEIRYDYFSFFVIIGFFFKHTILFDTLATIVASTSIGEGTENNKAIRRLKIAQITLSLEGNFVQVPHFHLLWTPVGA